jgi:arginine dihydrolase
MGLSDNQTMQPLGWGRRYALVRPTHFRVDYQINPFMRLDRQPDPGLAMAQWNGLVSAIEAAGAVVDVIEQRPDSPDMVYAMNLGLAVGEQVVLSHMRYAERRLETPSARVWFESRGLRPGLVGAGGVGPHFESGDAFPYAGRLVVGHGPRTEEYALKHLATSLGVRVHGVRMTHPGMYHLDLAFCPLDQRHALICPAAFDDESVAALLDLVPDPIMLTEDEAMTFCANSIVVGQRVLMPSCPARVRPVLESAGFEVVVVDVSQFHKGGGSVRCLTNPLDIAVGRDLDYVAGGAVATG